MLGFALFLATTALSHAEPALYRPSDKAVIILAEGEEEIDPSAKPKPKLKRRVIKPKAPVPVETPTAPIPYAAPADKAAPAVTATPMAPVTPQNLAPQTLTPAPPPAPEGLAYPPPPPEKVYVYPLLDKGTPKEISLRCETLTVFGPKESSRGVFVLSLIPSLVNPNEFADLRVMSMDQNHRSIIRDTGCFSYMCGLSVTPGYYELSTPNRNKSQLKVTLNRQTGAFFAYEHHPDSIAAGLINLSKRTEVNETGWCVPIAPGKALF